jgi:hypothetical protein
MNVIYWPCHEPRLLRSDGAMTYAAEDGSDLNGLRRRGFMINGQEDELIVVRDIIEYRE